MERHEDGYVGAYKRDSGDGNRRYMVWKRWQFWDDHDGVDALQQGFKW